MAWRRGAARPLVLGHRGASAHAVENTMTAFAAAASAGADGVELDVRLTRDGALVVFHDDDLQRLAGRPERIDGLTAAEVAAISLTGGEHIPTLDQVFAELPDLLVNVEIKSPGPRHVHAAVRAVAAAIERASAAERVVVSSFDPAAVGLARLMMTGVRVGLLFHARQRRPLREAWPAVLIRPYALHPDRLLVDADQVAGWRRDGYALHVWTVDGAAEVNRLADLGVDALITNDPAATIAVLDGRSA